jgi:hypothetical protein
VQLLRKRSRFSASAVDGTFHHKRENIPFREATMPTTRSMRALSTVVSASAAAKSRPSSLGRRESAKRRIEEADTQEFSPSPQIIKKARVAAPSTVLSAQAQPSSETNQVLPAVLSFSFEAAKQHLIKVDARFEAIFKQLPCRPFEQLERVDPFRCVLERYSAFKFSLTRTAHEHITAPS